MMVLDVTGMTCGHCRNAVTRAAQSVDPAVAVRVDLATGRVEIETGRSDPQAFIAAVEAAGYGATVAHETSTAVDGPAATRSGGCCCG